MNGIIASRLNQLEGERKKTEDEIARLEGDKKQKAKLRRMKSSKDITTFLLKHLRQLKPEGTKEAILEEQIKGRLRQLEQQASSSELKLYIELERFLKPPTADDDDDSIGAAAISLIQLNLIGKLMERKGQKKQLLQRGISKTNVVEISRESSVVSRGITHSDIKEVKKAFHNVFGNPLSRLIKTKEFLNTGYHHQKILEERISAGNVFLHDEKMKDILRKILSSSYITEEISIPWDYSLATIYIWWDLENCRIPSSNDGSEFSGNVQTYLESQGCYGNIVFSGYGDTSKAGLSADKSERICKAGFKIVEVPYVGRKEVADKFLIVEACKEMYESAVMKSQEPQVAMIIAGDRDYISLLNALAGRGFKLFVVCKDDEWDKQGNLTSQFIRDATVAVKGTLVSWNTIAPKQAPWKLET